MSRNSIRSLTAFAVFSVSFVPPWCNPSFGAEPARVTYTDHVLPILRDKCLGCHNADKARGGLDASNFVKLMEGGSSGAVVKPGDPDDSRLYMLAAHKAEPKMPPKADPLPAEQVAILKRWIEQGALEHSGSKAPIIAKKSEVASASIVKGRPAGPPPMPKAVLPQTAPGTRHPAAVTALSASPWAPLVAVAAPHSVLLYNTDTFDLIGALPFPYGQVNVLRFSRSGALLLAGGGRGGKEGRVVVWNVADGRVLTEVGDEHDAVLAADISADQTQIALGGPGKTVRVYATADGQLLREIKKHTDWITAIEYSPDGVLLATADRSSGLWVWEAQTGREFFGLTGHKAMVTGLSWRDDSNVLASCSEDTSVKLWEMENGKLIKSFGTQPGGALSVRYGHDNRILTTGRDGVTRMWNEAGAGQRGYEKLSDMGTHAVFTHDGSRVIAGDLQGLIRVWNSADGKRVDDLSTNPPSAADRLLAARKALPEAEKALVEKEAALAKATTARDAAKVAAAKAEQELAPLRKVADDTANIVRVVARAMTDGQSAADRAVAAVTSAQLSVQARDVKATVLAETAAKLRDAAAKAANNGELKQAADQAQQIAVQAAAERDAARKALADATTAAKTATEHLAAAKKAAADTGGPADVAAKALAAKQQAAKAAMDAATKAQADADRLTAEVNAARAAIEKLKATVAAAK
jgi:Planctomycete cytochrome C/Anaphase-promoting complex subunit 4 WD40 domain